MAEHEGGMSYKEAVTCSNRAGRAQGALNIVV